MSYRSYVAGLFAAGAIVLSTAGPSAAARLRYHYAPDPGANGSLKPAAAGERLSLSGWQPYSCPPPRATRLVTFRHPFTGKCVTLALYLPDSTPRVDYARDRIMYDYGSYSIEVRFLKDGSADVVYDSGLFRAP